MLFHPFSPLWPASCRHFAPDLGGRGPSSSPGSNEPPKGVREPAVTIHEISHSSGLDEESVRRVVNVLEQRQVVARLEPGDRIVSRGIFGEGNRSTPDWNKYAEVLEHLEHDGGDTKD